MQFAHALPEDRIDLGLDVARDLDAIGQLDPDEAALLGKTGDGHLAALPADNAAVRQLPAAAGIERMLRQPHGTGPRLKDLGVQPQDVGMFLAEEACHGWPC
ncbi:hypothetical protein D9M68_853240 [compost metagenome]